MKTIFIFGWSILWMHYFLINLLTNINLNKPKSYTVLVYAEIDINQDLKNKKNAVKVLFIISC